MPDAAALLFQIDTQISIDNSLGRITYPNGIILAESGSDGSFNVIVMSNKSIFWLFVGIGIGVLLHIWWMQQARICAALTNFDNRLIALENENRQRMLPSVSRKDKVKLWFAGIIAFASVIKFMVILVQLCGHHVRF